jgi:hypothetical protein
MDERYDWELSETELGGGSETPLQRKAGSGALASGVGAVAMAARIASTVMLQRQGRVARR